MKHSIFEKPASFFNFLWVLVSFRFLAIDHDGGDGQYPRRGVLVLIYDKGSSCTRLIETIDNILIEASYH
jgi:hypothetical protein